ncbi:hypothetical protein PYCC9005_003037 [Savitreella phatthalungensis]
MRIDKEPSTLQKYSSYLAGAVSCCKTAVAPTIEAVFECIMGMITQTIKQSSLESPMMMYIARTSRPPSGGSFYPAHTISSKCAGLIYCAQLMIMRHIAQTHQFPINDALAAFCGSYLCNSRSTPMGFLLLLNCSLRRAAEHERSSTQCSYVGGAFLVDGLSVTLEQLAEVYHSTLTHARGLYRELTFGTDMHVELDKLLPARHSDKFASFITDNMLDGHVKEMIAAAERSKTFEGQGWLRHSAAASADKDDDDDNDDNNSNHVPSGETDDLEDSFEETTGYGHAAGCMPVFVPTVVASPVRFRYRAQALDLVKSLAVLCHAYASTPMRGTELLQTTVNTNYRGRRGLSFESGMLMLSAQHAKTTRTTRNDVVGNHRYLPPEVAQLVVDYCVYVAPMLRALCGVCAPQVAFMFATVNNRPLTSDQLRRSLQACCARAGCPPINLAQLRQIAEVITRSFMPDKGSPDTLMRDAFLKQSGHTAHTATHHYGQLAQVGPLQYLGPEDCMAILGASSAWQMVFGIRPAGQSSAELDSEVSNQVSDARLLEAAQSIIGASTDNFAWKPGQLDLARFLVNDRGYNALVVQQTGAGKTLPVMVLARLVAPRNGSSPWWRLLRPFVWI